MPEAKLAREAELCYATLALATDYDVLAREPRRRSRWRRWWPNLLKNVATAKVVLRARDPAGRQAVRRAGCGDALASAVITDPKRLPAAHPQAPRPAARPLLPGPPRPARRNGAPWLSGELDVVGIGNALVDVLSHADEAWSAAGPDEGDHAAWSTRTRARALYEAMGPGVEMSGGSAANTVVGRGLLRRPGRTTWARSATTSSATCSATTCARPASATTRRGATSGPPTGRCLILVTPGRPAHDEHVPRRLGAARPGRRRPRPDRAGRRSSIWRATSSIRRTRRRRSAPRPPIAARGRAQGRAHALRPVLRGAAPRRVPRPGRAPRRHPVRQRGRRSARSTRCRLRRRAAARARALRAGRADPQREGLGAGATARACTRSPRIPVARWSTPPGRAISTRPACSTG